MNINHSHLRRTSQKQNRSYTKDEMFNSDKGNLKKMGQRLSHSEGKWSATYSSTSKLSIRMEEKYFSWHTIWPDIYLQRILSQKATEACAPSEWGSKLKERKLRDLRTRGSKTEGRQVEMVKGDPRMVSVQRPGRQLIQTGAGVRSSESTRKMSQQMAQPSSPHCCKAFKTLQETGMNHDGYTEKQVNKSINCFTKNNSLHSEYSTKNCYGTVEKGSEMCIYG